MAESASDPRNHEVHGDVHLFFCARLPARGDLAMSQRAAERAGSRSMSVNAVLRLRGAVTWQCRSAPRNGLGSRSMSVNAVLRVPGAVTWQCRSPPRNRLGSRSMSVNAVLRVPGAAARRRAARANDWAAPPAADGTPARARPSPFRGVALRAALPLALVRARSAALRCGRHSHLRSSESVPLRCAAGGTPTRARPAPFRCVGAAAPPRTGVTLLAHWQP
jgi:hypothetical protein